MNDTVKPIFVGGAMRSGTTLLQQITCTSPDTNPAINPSRYLSAQINLYARYMGEDSLFITDYFGSKERFTDFTRQLLQRVMSETWAANGKPGALVMKTVDLTRVLPALVHLLPVARFVVSVRDPKDTIASMRTVADKQRRDGINSHLSRTGDDLAAMCETYNGYYLPLLQFIKSRGEALRNRILFIRYEDMARTPDTVAADVWRFCGVAEGALPNAPNATWRNSPHMSEVAGHTKWRTFLTDLSDKPISASRIGSHAETFSPEDCAEIDRRCEIVGATFGYNR